ncbi:response regulator transcription factor [candidate division CSSED10-310 bacterium]|uniref:Response regulator transcription factor n=1 Tax=candidate division CSSED10-310 bacterium TaxID=2855610 RepID=A0ABV6Z5U6_UNCC1
MMKKILVVDDEPNSRILVSLILTNAGFATAVAENGFDAFNKICVQARQNAQFDLILLDNMMPEMSGLELIDELHNNDFNIPTLVMSAFFNKETVQMLKERGCEDYLSKPFLQKDLVSRVTALV